LLLLLLLLLLVQLCPQLKLLATVTAGYSLFAYHPYWTTIAIFCLVIFSSSLCCCFISFNKLEPPSLSKLEGAALELATTQV
jgi:hypothetical protein